jgi:hypothetical protein
MICDYLHSFYSMPVNLWVGGVLHPTTIRWYRAPAGAKLFPYPNAFYAKSVWDNHDEIDGEPGELGEPRTWDPGRNVGYQGQCFLGDPSWFKTGQLPAYVLTQAPPPSPCLCQIPPAIAAGGLVLGGAAAASKQTPPTGCPFAATQRYTVRLSGVANKACSTCSLIDGIFTLTYIPNSACQFAVASTVVTCGGAVSNGCELTISSTSVLVAFAGGGGQYKFTGSWNGTGTLTVPKMSDDVSGACSWPPIVTVAPSL